MVNLKIIQDFQKNSRTFNFRKKSFPKLHSSTEPPEHACQVYKTFVAPKTQKIHMLYTWVLD